MRKLDNFKYIEEKLSNIIFDILKIYKKLKILKLFHMNQNFYNFRPKKKEEF